MLPALTLPPMNPITISWPGVAGGFCAVAFRPASPSPGNTRRPATATASARPARATGGEARSSCGAPTGCATIGEHSPKARSTAAHPVRLARNSQVVCNRFSTRNLSNARCDRLFCGHTLHSPSVARRASPPKFSRPGPAAGCRFAQAALVALRQTCATDSRLRSIAQARLGCTAPPASAQQTHGRTHSATRPLRLPIPPI